MFILRCFLTYQLFLLVICAPGDEHVAEIYNGKVLGVEGQTGNNVTFYTFQGIPYAKPPVGALRFAAPQSASNWTGIYNATYPRSQCVSPGASMINATVIGQEDCLYINVYSPQLPDNDSVALPVLFWIYGGAFVSGSGAEYNPERFIDAGGILFVSFNYRLGPFGFLSTEDENCPGNYGIKDQVLALQWVQQNIATFGGDPRNVTIMGESAGAASVQYLIQSEKAAGTFHRAIQESGNSLVPWSQAANARKLAFRIGVVNFILTTSSKSLIEGLRKVSAKRLMQTAFLPSFMDLFDPLNGLPFAPVIEKNSSEAVITNKSYEQQRLGNFNKVPVLLGFNSLEGGFISTLPWSIYGTIVVGPFNIFPCKLCPEDMNPTSEGCNLAGSTIKNFYFGNGLVTANANLSYYISDDEFVRGIVKSAQLMSKFVPIYLYRFAFIGGVQHSNFTPEGVVHAEELQFLFLSNSSVQVTEEANLTVLRMVQMWTNFAKTGNPTPYLTENINVTWPLLNETGDTDIHYLNIDTELTAEINPEEKQMKFWDSLYTVYGRSPYNTY